MSNSTQDFIYTPRRTSAEVATTIRAQMAAMRQAAPYLLQNLPDVEPTPEEQESFDALVIDLQGSATPDSAGVELAAGLRTHAGCVVALIGGLAAGGFWDECSKRSGISYISAQALRRWNKNGFGKLLKAAVEQHDRVHVTRMRKALVKRSVEGVDNYKIGRIGKDQDGILHDDNGAPIVERKFSDKLLEFGLSKLDKDTFGEVASTTNIGQQVVYNLNGLSFGQQSDDVPDAADRAKPVDAAEAGNNPATIDMSSLGDLTEVLDN